MQRWIPPLHPRQGRRTVRCRVQPWLSLTCRYTERSWLLEELLVVEFDLRQRDGQELDLEAYRQRFPGSEAIIDAAVAIRRRREQPVVLSTCSKAPIAPAKDDQHPVPAQIGRFQIRRRLGRGGFGVVYLAHDPGLDRLVALKVPRAELLTTGQQRANFLHEARTAAKLKHPALVAVYEVQQENDLIYIVQEYIEGQNLGQWAATQLRSWEDIAGRMIEIVTAIGYVHQQGVYHRDLKPGNILIDNDGHAHVADFGLAVHEDALRMLKGMAHGTPAYMSPEQVRGETHWIDGRTDIWALGVILYDLLAGHRPFTAPVGPELYAEIQERDPKSPRMKNPSVPKELERICRKCLAKRRSHRYATASDLLEDLQAFVATCQDPAAAAATDSAHDPAAALGASPVAANVSTIRLDADSTPRQSIPDSGSQPALRIVPKGLRSFDEDDRDFFLELLPGPRDRDGLPDSIRFWKTLIEKTDADATFPVGVMYGPSGCGKSSLVKAGLLPHLASDVLPIRIAATANETERRLVTKLQQRIPPLGDVDSLIEALARIREGGLTDARKILLVLDQFEQWLYATANMERSQLTRALRQCDGAHVQCLILVRDDFWMSITRFMQALEVPQLEGRNSAPVQLFDLTHARSVLQAFGVAYGRLPEQNLSADQHQFLDRAVQELADDEKVICVRLSLFAEMMRGRPWTPTSLMEVGGTSGLGVAFLDETFTAKTAPPTHRMHAKSAQAVLKSMLPEGASDIRGQMQPVEQMLDCSGYANRPGDFRNLIHILNDELRLITPADPGEELARGDGDGVASLTGKYFQLTHDYLVPLLRSWLTRKQRETPQGRAQLRLAERTSVWSGMPEKRHLPSLYEHLQIRTFTRPSQWTQPQRQMMAASGRLWGTRTALMLFVLMIGAAAGIVSRNYLQSLTRKQHAQVLVQQLLTADLENVLPLVTQLNEYRDLANPDLRIAMTEYGDDPAKRLKVSLALSPVDPQEAAYLVRRLESANASEARVIRTVLAERPRSADLTQKLWGMVESSRSTNPTGILSVASTLALLHPDDARWNDINSAVAEALVASNSLFSGEWVDMLKNVRKNLLGPLRSVYVDHTESRIASQRELATRILEQYADDQPELLAELLLVGDAGQFKTLFPVASHPRNRDTVIDYLEKELNTRSHRLERFPAPPRLDNG